MNAENRKEKVPFVCPRCLAVYHVCIRKTEGITKCDYCGIPLERIKNRR